MKHLSALAILLAIHGTTLKSQIVFPSPKHVEMNNGQLVLHRQVALCAPDTASPSLALLRAEVLGQTPIRWTTKPAKADICWQTDSTLPDEAYRISITPQRIQVDAGSEGGFVYAVQTLRQWMTASGNHLSFPCAQIDDAPRMQWRGFMLDSGRQFQQPSTIKKYIDMASMLKMNFFHWHLTEGLGWRIEIKRYPHLAQVGGHVAQGTEQQGFYTQQEIRDIVDYAARRNVTIVPEIDMPGHSEAALSAYPELGCFGQQVQVPQNGFTHNILCAGKDEVLLYMYNVLDEVCNLFPSSYIHLGGDEAPKVNWDKCPDCQKRIATEGLQDTHDLQLWFSAQMAEYLKKKGRKAIFWGDIVYRDGHPLPENTVIQWWNYRGHKDLALRNAAKHNLPVICSPNYYTYLNFPVSPWRGYSQERTFDLEDAYLNNPADKLDYGKGTGALGMSCALWTDYGVTEAMIDERIFPRILVLAEQMWHLGSRDNLEAFYRHICQREAWFKQQGYAFGPAFKLPSQ